MRQRRLVPKAVDVPKPCRYENQVELDVTDPLASELNVTALGVIQLNWQKAFQPRLDIALRIYVRPLYNLLLCNVLYFQEVEIEGDTVLPTTEYPGHDLRCCP